MSLRTSLARWLLGPQPTTAAAPTPEDARVWLDRCRAWKDLGRHAAPLDVDDAIALLAHYAAVIEATGVQSVDPAMGVFRVNVPARECHPVRVAPRDIGERAHIAGLRAVAWLWTGFAGLCAVLVPVAQHEDGRIVFGVTSAICILGAAVANWFSGRADARSRVQWRDPPRNGKAAAMEAEAKRIEAEGGTVQRVGLMGLRVNPTDTIRVVAGDGKFDDGSHGWTCNPRGSPDAPHFVSTQWNGTGSGTLTLSLGQKFDEQVKPSICNMQARRFGDRMEFSAIAVPGAPLEESRATFAAYVARELKLQGGSWETVGPPARYVTDGVYRQEWRRIAPQRPIPVCDRCWCGAQWCNCLLARGVPVEWLTTMAGGPGSLAYLRPNGTWTSSYHDTRRSIGRVRGNPESPRIWDIERI